MLHDPISDLLTQIRNASKARKRYVDIRHSKIKEGLVKVLREKGFVAHYLIKEENKKSTMRIFLKYTADRTPIIQGLRRVSKPSLRRFVTQHEIPRVVGGLGIAIVSTSKGLMEGERARSSKIGGELLALVW